MRHKEMRGVEFQVQILIETIYYIIIKVFSCKKRV